MRKQMPLKLMLVLCVIISFTASPAMKAQPPDDTYFEAAGKIANWPIITGQPRLMGLLNWNSRQIGSGPLFLLYDQPVSINEIKAQLDAAGPSETPLKFHAYRPKNAKQVTESTIDTRQLAAVVIKNLPENGKKIQISIPDWKDGVLDPLVYTLTVNTTFKLSDKYIRNPRKNGFVRLSSTWQLEFNNPFELPLLQNALAISPKPKSMEITGSGWTQARVRVQLEPGIRYRMTIDKNFTDILGNHLDPKVEITFDSEDLPPILEVPAAPVLLERISTRLPVKIRNVRMVEANLYRFDSPRDFFHALSMGRKKNSREYGLNTHGQKLKMRVREFTPNKTTTFDLKLDGKPGLMCLEVAARGLGSDASGIKSDAVLVQCTDLGITTKVFRDNVFAWVTRLHDASPVPGAKVTLYKDDGGKMGQGITDRFGAVTLDASGAASHTGLDQPVNVVVETGGDTAVSRLVDKHLSKPWQFGLKGTVRGTGKFHAALFTERGVYRPGETVHLKVMTGKTPAPGSDDVELHIRDPRGRQVVKETLPLDRFGSAGLDVKLKEEAAVGQYMVQAAVTRNGETKEIAVHNFSVEEYRVPTFKVSVKSEAKSWGIGTGIDAIISADYLHGGSLGGREVRWEVLRRPQPFAPPAFPKYLFRVGDVGSLTGRIASGKEKLDGRGRKVVNFKANHPSSAGPMRYVVEASVTDVDRQTYAGRLSKVVHPAAFYVGVLPPPRKVLKSGDTLQVPIIAVKPGGKAVENVRVTVRLERIDHHTAARMAADSTVRMLNRPVPVTVKELTVKTGKTAVNCTFKLPQAGLYRVNAGAKDKNHRDVRSGFEITVSGDTPTAWPRFDRDQIEITADKPAYKPGDTAKLVVQTPYKHAQGLLTIERDGVLTYKLFSVRGNTPTLRVPITDAHAPNVFVSVILLRGRVHYKKDASGFETGAPGFKIGCINLGVETRDRRLAIKVKPAREKANPGQRLKIDFTVQDHTGAPRSGQAVVMVVDEAVLGLTGYLTPDPVKQIYSERPLGVRTGSSRLDLPHARRARLEKMFPGGDGVKKRSFADFALELRNLFKSTAYWNPDVAVGKDGKASVEFELPDNLTTYRIMAVVTDGRGRVGSADKKVLVRKPLMIQPVVPRFLYPNDEMQIEALVFNGTGTFGEIRLDGDFSGLELTGGASSLRAGVKPGESHSFTFAVKVTGKKEASIRFAANLEGHTTDGVEIKLPILGPGNRRSIVLGKPITGTGKVSMKLPADRVPGSVKMEVVTSSTVLSELKDSVQYLMGYPNGCIEQTTSTAYPLVVLKDLLPEMGIEVNRADLKKFSEAGVRRILSFQTPSGGLSYWPGSSQPHAFATAFGLTALIEAKKRGYDVPDNALDGMADYLEAALRRGKITESIPHGNMADGDTRALFVMTLGRLGRPQPGYISVLWREREKLTAFGLSFLAIAVKEMPGDQSLLEPILEEIRRAAREEEKEAYFTGKRKGGWSMDSPLRTHASALIAYAAADGPGDMSGKLLTGLLKRRSYGLWGNTQENVFGIMGVHALASKKTGGDGPKIELNVHGKDIGETEMEALSKRVRRFSLEESDLGLREGKEETREVLVRNNGNSAIILTVRAQYETPLSEENCKAWSNGFTITRRYETMEGESLEGKTIPLGSLVRVRLSIRTDGDHHYVAIDDKLPAGLEPLNAALETTEKVSQGKFTAAAQRSLSVLSYKEIRDSRVAFFVDEMLRGDYEYTYVARATTPGEFLRPAGRAEAMYEPEICGVTSIDKVKIK